MPKSEGNQTNLVSIKVSSASEAQRRFGERANANGVVPFRATVTGGCCGCLVPWFTIPEGFYATVQQLGREIDYEDPETRKKTPNWPPGRHTKGSFFYCCGFGRGIRELITKQTVVFDTPVTDVMTKDNISVQIDLCLQLRIAADVEQNEDPYNLTKFTDKLGVVSLMSQLADTQAEAVRMMARTQLHSTVYGLRAMDVSGKVCEIDLSTLNDDDFGPESDLKIDSGATTDKMRQAMSAPKTSPEMDRSSGDDVKVLAAVKTAESTEYFEGQNLVRASDDPKNILMVDSTSSRGQERMTDMMLKNLNEQFNQYGVEITDLQIQDVRLPPKLQSTVSAKTTVATSRALEAMIQKKKIQTIEFENESKLKDQEYGNEGEKIVERGKRMVAEVNNELARERAKTKQAIREVQEKAKSKKAKIDAETNKEVAVLLASASQISSLPKFVPTAEEAKMLGGQEHAGKEIVAENAAQMVLDYTKGEITKRKAKGNLEVAKINAETDRAVAELDAETNRILTLPMLLVTKELAQQCGKPEWEKKEVLAETVAKMLTENASSEVKSMEADAHLAVARAQAAATKAVYAAEGQAASALKDKRAFELAKSQLDVYESLARNRKVTFFGSDSGSAVPSMVTLGGGYENRDGGNINGGVGPWDAVRQLTESVAVRIARGVVSSNDNQTI